MPAAESLILESLGRNKQEKSRRVWEGGCCSPAASSCCCCFLSNGHEKGDKKKKLDILKKKTGLSPRNSTPLISRKKPREV